MNQTVDSTGDVRPKRVELTEFVHGGRTNAELTSVDAGLHHLALVRPKRYRLGQTVTIAVTEEKDAPARVMAAEIVQIIDKAKSRICDVPPGIFVELIGGKL